MITSAESNFDFKEFSRWTVDPICNAIESAVDVIPKIEAGSILSNKQSSELDCFGCSQ